MADPVLDEDYIIELLRSPCRPGAVSLLMSGAVQALMNLYDRKVTRDEFLAMAAPCITLYGQANKMWILENIRQVYEDGFLDTDRFKAAEEGIADLLRKQCEIVIEQVKRCQQCPTSEDVVH